MHVVNTILGNVELDDHGKRFIESHDDPYWVETVRKLTYEAIRLLAQYGFGGGNHAERAADYALAALSEVFIRASKGSPNRFDPARGDMTKHVEERFWSYLTLNCLRPLLTRDAEKWVRRSRWPQVPLEAADHYPIQGDTDSDNRSTELFEDLLKAASDDLKKLLLAARAQLEAHPDRKDVNWRQIQDDLSLTRYRCDSLRRELNHLRTAANVAPRQPVESGDSLQ